MARGAQSGGLVLQGSTLRPLQGAKSLRHACTDNQACRVDSSFYTSSEPVPNEDESSACIENRVLYCCSAAVVVS